MKQCSKCGIEKPLSEFYKSKRDGIISKCKKCTQQYYISNKDRVIEYQKKNKNQISLNSKRYYIENKDKISHKDKLRYWNNKDYELQRNKDYTLLNKERISLQKRQYYINNRDIKLEYNKYYKNTPNGKFSHQKSSHKRRDLTRKLPCTLTLEEWNEILQQQNNKCKLCGREFNNELKPTKDHIIPLSSGRHDAGLTCENVQALCQSCNSKKWKAYSQHKSLNIIKFNYL